MRKVPEQKRGPLRIFICRSIFRHQSKCAGCNREGLPQDYVAGNSQKKSKGKRNYIVAINSGDEGDYGKSPEWK